MCDSGRNAIIPEDPAMTHRVAVLLVPPVVPFDTTIPGLVLGLARLRGEPCYEVRTCTPVPGPLATHTDMEIVVRHGLEVLDEADTIVVPGTYSREETDPRVFEALRRAAAEGRRLVSICTGAFMLGMAGILDGRRVTTYWRRSEEFASRFPAVEFDPRVLFVDDGQVLTSAGLAAGIDLCLHIIRSDFGATVANDVARLVVMAPVRQGGQAQFIAAPIPSGNGAASLAATREWALRHLDRPLALADLAGHARVSVRTLTRRFRAETGMAPLQWLLHSRVERAKELLESTALPVGEVARLSGLGSADSLRAHLVRRAGLTPTAYRAAFSGTPAGAPAGAPAGSAPV
jgi:transcriptional regulator GlxA family with amidase domain